MWNRLLGCCVEACEKADLISLGTAKGIEVLEVGLGARSMRWT